MPEPTPQLLSFQDVAAQLPLGQRPSERAARLALRRLIRRANDARHDRRLPELRPVRIGRVEFYRADFVAELIGSL